MEYKNIDCTNFAQRVKEKEDIDDDTKIKLVQLIKDFEVQYKSFNWNTL